jgi:hypothetical protein
MLASCTWSQETRVGALALHCSVMNPGKCLHVRCAQKQGLNGSQRPWPTLLRRDSNRVSSTCFVLGEHMTLKARLQSCADVKACVSKSIAKSDCHRK